MQPVNYAERPSTLRRVLLVIMWTLMAIVAAGGLLVTAMVAGVVKSGLQRLEDMPKVDKSPAAQTERQEIIQQLITAGVFDRVEMRGNGIVKAYVGPAWDSASYEKKQLAAGVVYSYHHDGSSSAGAVWLIDRQGRRFAAFSRVGMELD